MAGPKENLEVLRALLKKPGLKDSMGEASVRLGHLHADAALCGGIRRGALHEVFAHMPGDEAAATGFALALAARVLTRRKHLLWIRQDFSALEMGDIYGCGLLELGIDPECVLMLRAPDAKAVLRASTEGLDCKGLGAVVIEPWGKAKLFDLVASRRLALAAQQYDVTPIVLRFGAEPEPSAAETRWLIEAAKSSPNDEDWGRPRFDASLVRNRRGNNGHWIMEWDCNNGIFQAHSERLPSPAAYRPADTPVEGIRQAG